MSPMYRKLLGAACMAAGVLFTVNAAVAQDDAAIIKYRQKLMDSNGANLGAIGDILKYQLPYGKDIAGHARALSLVAAMIPEAFKRKVTEGKTDAKPKIWDNWRKFEGYADKLVKASDKLAQVAGSGDSAAVVSGVKGVADACKKCHDDFRKPKSESYRNKK